MLTERDQTHLNRIAAAARNAGWSVMTAESCTGGLLAAALTSEAGASDWFGGAIVAYCNTLKQQLLQVPADTLETCGAVSEETAAAMCGGLRNSAADVAVSVTGIAGPGGGSDEKPVGTVCFGVLTPAQTHTFTRHFSGDRAAIRAAAVSCALEQLAAALGNAQ